MAVWNELEKPATLKKKSLHQSKFPKWNFSFAGCGFLGLYHAGVCGCLQEFAPYLINNQKVSGASAGAIAATSLICDVNLGECVQYLMNLVNKAQSYRLGPFDPRFKITDHLREGLDLLLPSDAHIRCSGRLHISMTSQSNYKNVIVNQFKTREELIRAILCSSYIPIFSGFIPLSFRGEWMIDGGLTNNIPELDSHTITVSPFCGDADICPRDDWGCGHIFVANTSLLLNFDNLARCCNIVWPGSPAKLSELVQRGYNDTLRFLVRQGMITCNTHLVFMTVKLHPAPSSGKIPEGCPHCKQILRKALTSTIPEAILDNFKVRPKGSFITQIVTKRLLRAINFLLKPVVVPWNVFYQVLIRVAACLTYLPNKSPLENFKCTIDTLCGIFKESFQASSSIVEGAQQLCQSLNKLDIAQFFPSPSTTHSSWSKSVQLLSDVEELDELENLDDRNSINTTDEESEAFGNRNLAGDIDIQPINGTAIKNLLSRTNSNNALFDKLEEVEGITDHLHFEYAQQSDIYSTGMNSDVESEFDFNLNPPQSAGDLADLILDSDNRLAYSYRDYNGAEEVKMFMVLPCHDSKSSRHSSFSSRKEKPSYQDASSREELCHNESIKPTNLDQTLDSSGDENLLSPISGFETDFSVDN